MKFLYIVFMLFTLSLWGDELLIKKSGELRGILNAKGEAWVEVHEDNGLLERYLAPWQGESPARGGGFDREKLRVFKDLIVGNRVYLDWFWDGHLRVRKIKQIRPFKSSGVFNGTLINKSDKWIDVENEESLVLWRFYAKWVGGLPDDGGGYHPATVEFFDNFEENDPVRFKWSYDYRPRIDRFIEQEDEDAFVPFYEGKTIPVGSTKSSPLKPLVNPFDKVVPVSPVNPFDQLPTKNPFDQLPDLTPLNPFELDPKKGGNPFDSVNPDGSNPFESIDNKKQESTKPVESNPFDNAPKVRAKEANPFENVPLPGNPFDAVPQ